MKKIISAWIEQEIEFDTLPEYQKFLRDLKKSGKEYRILTPAAGRVDGKYYVHVMRQYNNNNFPGWKVNRNEIC